MAWRTSCRVEFYSDSLSIWRGANVAGMASATMVRAYSSVCLMGAQSNSSNSSARDVSDVMLKLLYVYNIHLSMWTSKHSNQWLMVSANFKIVSMDVQEEFCTTPLHRQGFPLKLRTYRFSIYTLSDLGVLSNLIGSLSLANEHYSPPTE